MVLRHAKSDRDGFAGPDHDRPLNARGRRNAPLMGRFLRKISLIPDQVICSPAKRTRQTSSLLLEKCGYAGQVDHCDEIYEGDAHDLHDLILRQASGDRVLLVGHNPTLEEFLGLSLGQGEYGIRLPTAALACLQFDIPDWADLDSGTGQLQWMVIPRLLEKLMPEE